MPDRSYRENRTSKMSDIDAEGQAADDANRRLSRPTHPLLRKNLGNDTHYGVFGTDTASSHDKQLAEREIHGTSQEAEEAKHKAEEKVTHK